MRLIKIEFDTKKGGVTVSNDPKYTKVDLEALYGRASEKAFPGEITINININIDGQKYSPDKPIETIPPDQDSAVWPKSPEPLTGMQCEWAARPRRKCAACDELDEFLNRINRGEDTRLEDVVPGYSYEWYKKCFSKKDRKYL